MVGAVTDPSFGKMVAFGLGGVLVEVMKDITFRLAPVGKKDALSMLNGIAARKCCAACAVRKASTARRWPISSSRLSKLVNDFPEIREVDLNPIFATENGATAVDVRIVVGEQAAAARSASTQATILGACDAS